MPADPPRSQQSEQFVVSRTIEVIRVVVGTAVVDPDYARVELDIDGEVYEMSRPAAQSLGAVLHTAAGGRMVPAPATEEDR